LYFKSFQARLPKIKEDAAFFSPVERHSLNSGKPFACASLAGFARFEMACILLFTAEYSTRVLMSPFVTFDYEKLKMSMNYSDMKRIGGELRFVWGRLLRYIVLPMNLVDFFAIMPFYLELLMGTGGGFTFLRVLRLARVFRIFKMGKYSSGAKLLGRTLVKSFPALQLLVFFRCVLRFAVDITLLSLRGKIVGGNIRMFYTFYTNLITLKLYDTFGKTCATLK
jgi:hypothetical protein